MGAQNVHDTFTEAEQHAFLHALLKDVEALERLLAGGAIETGVRRIGAEQEMFLVGRDLRPAPVGPEVLGGVSDRRLTSELARFNLEANLTPLPFTGTCLRALEAELREVLAIADQAAGAQGAQVLLTGILPTLRKADLGLHNMTPLPRYARLNRAMTELRGGAFQIHIHGQDELHLDHDNVLVEACNTSFQVHLQVDPREFAPLYNLAQAIAAPVLAAAVNAPLFLGKRLWQETRVALFQHAVDARTGPELHRGQRPRVHFGDGWLRDSILELIHDDIARFRVVLTRELDEDPSAVLGRGEVPRLSALCLHSGTIWRWNRGCYGVCGGRPHLRIEHRPLPAGPTVLDEVANAALFFGLMTGLPAEHGPIERLLSFDDARGNFFAAARHGLKAQLTWLGGEVLPATALLRERLLPLAEQGLLRAGLDPEDVARYLGIIAERVRTEQTGASWILASLPGLASAGSTERRDQVLTAAMLARQRGDGPVHTWALADRRDQALVRRGAGGDLRVSECMSTDLFTARPDDLIDLAASVMQWRHVRHVPVEDGAGNLVGMLSHRDLLRALSQRLRGRADEAQDLTVAALMTPAPRTVTPQTKVRAAIRAMREHRIGCLPVVEGGRLVGILTEHDILLLAERLLGGESDTEHDPEPDAGDL